MLVQEKLLRVIEYGELERVGGSQPLQVNVRLVCATNADLPQMVSEGTFRADLLGQARFRRRAASPFTPASKRHHVNGRTLCHSDVP